jgi:hypothetical protein
VTSAVVSAPSPDHAARAPSATPALLRRLRTALVALVLLAFAAAVLLTFEEHEVTTSAGEHTAIAVIQAYGAQQALTDADSQAIATIPLGAGPSGQYEADIAAAEQSLEQVAENNTAGSSGSGALQLIEGLLPAYTGLIEQADAHYRMQVSGESGVGVEDLWSASELMHSQILMTKGTSTGPDDSLTGLRADEQGTLAAQRSSPWASPWLFAAWLIVAATLVGTLIAAQRQFSRRLRRALSKYLTLAAAAVIGLGLVTGHVIASEHAFDSAQSGPLATVVALQNFQTAGTDQQGQTALARLIGSACAQCSAEQGTAGQVTPGGLVKADAKAEIAALAVLAKGRLSAHDIPGSITQQQGAYAAEATAAGAGYVRSLLLIIVLSALLVLLTFLGFRRHLDEYRYRSS